MKTFSYKNGRSTEQWLRGAFITALLFWSIMLLSLGVWNYLQLKSSVYEIVHVVARDSIRHDARFREWATIHGGVYVPVTSVTQPNKYLDKIPGREIKTSSGEILTLMNPAYMLR